jgi:scyllo-inositol 2-dehydrogenase (NADP+)
MGEEIGVGVVGFGLAGRAFHAPVIRATPGLRLVAILQRHGDEAAEKYPDVRVVRSLDDLLAIPEIRLVVIATPNDTHAAIAKACLSAQRDVLVDKPFAPTLEEARSVVELARKCGRIVTVYQNRRYDGDFQAIRQIVGEGSIGRVVRFETTYDRYRPMLKANAWREKSGPGNGILFDLAPHLIDHALVLFGMPQAITADVRIERDQGVVDDAFDVLLHYPRGLRAALRASMLAVAARPRFVVQGTRGSLFKQSFDPQESNLRRGKVPENEAWGAEPQQDWIQMTTLEGESPVTTRVPSANCDYRDFYANLRDALLGKAKLAVTPEYALDAMRVLELARESSERQLILRWGPESLLTQV